MKIKDSGGSTRIEFTYFRFERENDPYQFITFDLAITFMEFTVKTKISAQLDDFEYMLNGFEKILYKNLEQTFTFST